MSFCSFMLEEMLISPVPGVAFGNDDHIRISYALGTEESSLGLKECLEKFPYSLPTYLFQYSNLYEIWAPSISCLILSHPNHRRILDYAYCGRGELCKPEPNSLPRVVQSPYGGHGGDGRDLSRNAPRRARWSHPARHARRPAAAGNPGAVAISRAGAILRRG